MEQGVRGARESGERRAVTSERDSSPEPRHTSRKRGSEDALRVLGLLSGLSGHVCHPSPRPPPPVKDCSARLLDAMSHSELGSFYSHSCSIMF